MFPEGITEIVVQLKLAHEDKVVESRRKPVSGATAQSIARWIEQAFGFWAERPPADLGQRYYLDIIIYGEPDPLSGVMFLSALSPLHKMHLLPIAIYFQRS